MIYQKKKYKNINTFFTQYIIDFIFKMKIEL